MPGLIPSDEEFRQASDGDVGTKQVINALVQSTKDVMSSEASMMHSPPPGCTAPTRAKSARKTGEGYTGGLSSTLGPE